MGFCWSGESAGPSRAGRRSPCTAGWVGPTSLLCFYGFCSMMRPIEPFMTEFLTGPYKNLTTEQVTRQVYPVWTYASLVLQVPVLLVTDPLRYKPVIILQGLTYVMGFLLILVGPGVRWFQLALLVYSVGTAADVAYSSYIYVMVPPSYYQRATSYVRGAVFVGYAAGSLLAQLLVSVSGVSLYLLGVLTLISVSAALLTSFFLPMPENSLFHKETCSAGQAESSEDSEDSEDSDDHLGAWIRAKSLKAAEFFSKTLRRLLLDCRTCFSSVPLLFFCIWAAVGRCGFFQVTGYVQVLWVHIQPHNFTAYNGGVDAVSTLSGAAVTVAVGHMTLNWSMWGELVLGVFTVLISGSLFLMCMTHNIWISYTCYFLFRTIFMQLNTICTFQIAKGLKRERYALVFGVIRFVGSVLQSLLTAIVINTESLQLTITSQFLVYASYFAAISLLFTFRGLYTAVHMKQQAAAEHQDERQTHLPQSHL